MADPRLRSARVRRARENRRGNAASVVTSITGIVVALVALSIAPIWFAQGARSFWESVRGDLPLSFTLYEFLAGPIGLFLLAWYTLTGRFDPQHRPRHLMTMLTVAAVGFVVTFQIDLVHVGGANRREQVLLGLLWRAGLWLLHASLILWVWIRVRPKRDTGEADDRR